MQAAIQIHTQLAQQYPGMTRGDVSFLTKGSRMVMDLVWPCNTTRFNSSIPLEIDGQRLAVVANASANPRWITILVSDLTASMIAGVAKTLKETFSPHQILDFWATYAEYTLPGTDETQRNFTGDFVHAGSARHPRLGR